MRREALHKTWQTPTTRLRLCVAVLAISIGATPVFAEPPQAAAQATSQSAQAKEPPLKAADPPAEGAKPTTTAPADVPASSLEALLRRTLAEKKVPALAAAVVRSGGLCDVAAVGVRKARSKAMVTTADRFHLGSCTKSMTASLCAMLVEEGKLRWDTTIAETWPDLAEKLHEDYRGVTLEQLLCHRGGLPDDRTPDLLLWPRVLALRGPLPEQRVALLPMLLAREPAHKPGTIFAYANFGTTIAGAMAEAATGESYESLMRQKVFDPLKMKTAGFGPPGDAKTLDAPRGHKTVLGFYASVTPGPAADNPQVIAPAGTAHMSLPDWAKYAAWHLQGAPGKTQLLSKKSFERLHRDPYGKQYALGWGLQTRPDVRGTILTHAGSNGMWFAIIWLAPEEDWGFLVCTNAGDERATEACRSVIESLIKQHIPPRKTPAEK